MSTPTRQLIAHSPWGVVQSSEELAPGIIEVSTASHGGIHVDEEHLPTIARLFPSHRPFSGSPGWYEEDCDWAIVALAFPEHFDDYRVRCAYQIARASAGRINAWECVTDFLKTEHAQQILARIKAWEAEHAQDWERGSCWSGRGMARTEWGVSLRRIGDGTEKDVVLRDYPSQRTYTDAELSVLVVKELER